MPDACWRNKSSSAVHCADQSVVLVRSLNHGNMAEVAAVGIFESGVDRGGFHMDHMDALR